MTDVPELVEVPDSFGGFVDLVPAWAWTWVCPNCHTDHAVRIQTTEVDADDELRDALVENTAVEPWETDNDELRVKVIFRPATVQCSGCGRCYPAQVDIPDEDDVSADGDVT